LKQDLVGALGIILVVLGIAHFSRAIALVALGLVLVVWAFGIAALERKSRT
jgi:hypothetical protein